MHIVESILQQAEQYKWSYPKKFEALKNAGVIYHTVRFIGNYDSVYEGTFGIWHEPTLPDYVSPILVNVFSEEGVKTALANRMQGKTSYHQFLADLAAVGVSHYKKEFIKRADQYIITYFNENKDQFYQQIVE